MADILLYGEIYSYSASEFVTAIDENTSDELVVRINSGGGEPEYGWGMIAKFSEYAGKKSLKVDGKAYSMGAFFCCYSDSVEALDVSQFLIHRAAYPSWFESSDYFTAALKSNLESINLNLRKALEAKIDVAKFEEIAGKKIKDIFSMDSRVDVFLTAAQAKSIGLIDKINKITPQKRAEIDNIMGAKIAAHYKPESSIEPQVKPVIQNKMTKEKLLAEHPEVHAMIVGLGVAQERDRVGAWMKFNDVDPAAVSAGITSGENISQTAMADFAVKVYAKQNLAALGTESPADLETKKAAEAAAKEAAEREAGKSSDSPLAAFEKEVNEILNLDKKA